MLSLIASWPTLAIGLCGDVNTDLAFDVADDALYRLYLADPTGNVLSPEGKANCTVIGSPRACDVLNRVVMARQARAAPLPPPLGTQCDDGDQDGVDDDVDLCRESAPGVPLLTPNVGCSSLDLVLRPEMVIDPPLLLFEEAVLLLASPELTDSPELQTLVATINGSMLEFELAEQDLRSGNVCAASAQWASMLGTLQTDRDSVQTNLAEIRLGIETLTPQWDPEHVADGQMAMLPLELGLAQFDRGISSAQTAADLLSATCSGVTGPLDVTGRITKLDDHARLLELDTGYQFALTSSSSGTDISLGQEVIVSGSGLGATYGQADSIEPVDPGSAPEISQIPCLFLRIAPVQAFPPLSVDPIVLHDPRAYELGIGVTALERGARLAVVSAGCPGTKPSFIGRWTRYSAKIDVEYLPGSMNFIGLTDDMIPGTDPVRLPTASQVLNGANATLIFKVRKQSCSFGFGGIECDPFTEYMTQTRTIRIFATGSLCTAVYGAGTTLHDLEDNDWDAFGSAFVDDVTVNTSVVEPGTGAAFEGQTCIAAPGAQDCSTGQIVTTAQDQLFRIYNHDFYPVHAPLDPLKNLFSSIQHGVTTAAGVRWPHVKGWRNVRSYWYSCGVPEVVRDVVDYCPGFPEDSYYRQPFYPTVIVNPTKKWVVGRGNVGQTPGHSGKQNFAWDIDAVGYSAADPHPIRAARGGRVVLLKESSTSTTAGTLSGTIQSNICYQSLKNCHNLLGSGSCTNDGMCGVGNVCRAGKCLTLAEAALCVTNWPCDNGNYLYIRHQDGTYATYWHMIQNGISVQTGNVVHRSDEIADSDDSGNSWGHHLHFHVQTSNGVDSSSSIRIRMQTQTNVCFIPLNDDESPSSNDPAEFY